MRKRIVTAEELPQLLQKWQGLMRLTNWNIEAKIIPMSDLPGLEASIDHDFDNRDALIRLGSEEGYTHFMAKPLDMEFNLVHELLHLYFEEVSPARDMDAQGKQRLEFAINAIAGAMIGLGQSPKGMPRVKPVESKKEDPTITLHDSGTGEPITISIQDILMATDNEELTETKVTLKNGRVMTVAESESRISELLGAAGYRGDRSSKWTLVND